MPRKKKSRGPQLYFAHPTIYNTLEERVIIHALETMGWIVINPGERCYQRAYKDRREARPNEDPMAYWLKLVKHCERCVFTTFPSDLHAPGVPDGDRRVSAGVFREVRTFLKNGLPVHWTPPDARKSEDVTLEEVTGWGKFTLLNVPQTKALLLAAGINTTR